LASLQNALAFKAFAVLCPHLAQAAHGWQMGEPIGSKALHTSAFMVDANEQVFSDCLDLGAQSRELCATLPIAAEQNNAACQRILKSLFVNRREAKTFNVNDERRLDVHSILSTTQ
jgi:hypothetical protein